jgi:hypothetical protein
MASTGLSGPIPVFSSLQPEETKALLDQDIAAMKTGLRAILKRIVDCQLLQLDQALVMVEDPFEVEVERPFGEEISERVSGQKIGSHPRAGTCKRPAEGEGDEPPSRKPDRSNRTLKKDKSGSTGERG